MNVFVQTQPSSNANGMTEVASSETDPLAGIRQTVWQIPRNFLDLSHVVIGRGRFGSVIKGRVNNRGAEDAAIVQVVPGKIMDEREMREMAKEVSSIHIIKSLSNRSIGYSKCLFLCKELREF